MSRRGHRAHACVVALSLGWLAGCTEGPPPADDDTGSSTTGVGSSSTTGQADSTGGVAQTPACMDYLECIAEVAPEQLPQAQAQYGPAGSCWTDAGMAAQCSSTCASETESLCPQGATGGGTGDPPLVCSIEGLSPRTISPVQAGVGAEELPLSIGDVLERNCGCHYIDPRTLEPDIPAYFGTISLATWADFQAPFMGTPTWQRVRQRSVVELSMPPPFFCDALDLGSLSAEDHALLGAWLDAGAPDAARWGR